MSRGTGITWAVIQHDTVDEKEEKNLQSTETNAKTQKGSGFAGTRTLFVT